MDLENVVEFFRRVTFVFFAQSQMVSLIVSFNVSPSFAARAAKPAIRVAFRIMSLSGRVGIGKVLLAGSAAPDDASSNSAVRRHYAENCSNRRTGCRQSLVDMAQGLPAALE